MTRYWLFLINNISFVFTANTDFYFIFSDIQWLGSALFWYWSTLYFLQICSVSKKTSELNRSCVVLPFKFVTLDEVWYAITVITQTLIPNKLGGSWSPYITVRSTSLSSDSSRKILYELLNFKYYFLQVYLMGFFFSLIALDWIPWTKVNIGSGNGLVPSGIKWLP